MQKISPSDDICPQRALPDSPGSSSRTIVSHSHSPSNSTSSMRSVSAIPFLPTGRHRLLPKIPMSRIRDPSSTRFFATPPPLSSESTVTASDSSLHYWNLDQRPTTAGRRLPQTPPDKDYTQSVIDQKNTSVRKHSVIPKSGDSDNVDRRNVIDNVADNEWPSPTIAHRKFSELRKLPQNDGGSAPTFLGSITCGSSLRSLQRLSILKQRHLLEEEGKQQYCLDYSSGASTSTSAHSQSSSLSHSTEQVPPANYYRFARFQTSKLKNLTNQ